MGDVARTSCGPGRVRHPIVSGVNIGLVVGLVFLISVASSSSAGACGGAAACRSAEDLLTANSAMWMPTRSATGRLRPGRLFVAFLGSALSLAFWIDGASYLASGALVASVTIPRIVPALSGDAGRGALGAVASLRSDVLAGWRFLRGETVLFATRSRHDRGIRTRALMRFSVAGRPVPLGTLKPATAYGFFEVSNGRGLLGGGVVIGAIASRVPRAAIVAGFTSSGRACFSR